MIARCLQGPAGAMRRRGLAVPVGECDPACLPALVGSGLTTGWGGGPELRVENRSPRSGKAWIWGGDCVTCGGGGVLLSVVGRGFAKSLLGQ